MTDAQKRQIIALRAAGLSYAKIGESIGLSGDTVKSFCRRYKESATVRECLNCGAEIAQIPGRKEKKFCSDTCRRAWWNAHLSDVNRKAYHTHLCPQCGERFMSYGNKVRTYCSRACYAAARRKAVLPDA